MARGRKNYTLEEQLEIVSDGITDGENKLKELKKKKNDLENQIKNQQLSDLNDLIVENGMTIEDVKSLIHS